MSDRLTAKPQCLFINTAKANCSIYESGKMSYESLLLSDRYILDYLELDETVDFIPHKYDFYIFNYHHNPLTMGWLNMDVVCQLPGFKATLVLETLPNDPFILCPKDVFDAYIALDPTMNVGDKRVYAFPRPLEVPEKITLYSQLDIPVIGSFGFPTPEKGFELLVEAVNKEFDEAIVRINIPSGTYADDDGQSYADYLSQLCKKTAKKGVQVVVTHDYMTKDELIEWCGQNTLNCFMYTRKIPGLSATTDQAISSGRPLIVSQADTFRHIHAYIRPYPLQSLKEAIATSKPQVLKIQKDWHPKNFALKFEKVLEDFQLLPKVVSETVKLDTQTTYIAKKNTSLEVKNSTTSQVYDLTIFSIFRQSEKYVHRYLQQVTEVFELNGGKCRAVWLEGDSTDNTYQILKDAKLKLEQTGKADVTLIKYDNHGPYWQSINSPNRWDQIATCWNNCLAELKPSKITISVESDLIYNSAIIKKLVQKLDRNHHVIYPMLMTYDGSYDQTPEFETFYDIWGMCREDKKFKALPPYWSPSDTLIEEEDLLQITTGGGMIVSTYEHQKFGKFDTSCCIMKYPPQVKLFMHKGLRIYHPMPGDKRYWKPSILLEDWQRSQFQVRQTRKEKKWLESKCKALEQTTRHIHQELRDCQSQIQKKQAELELLRSQLHRIQAHQN